MARSPKLGKNKNKFHARTTVTRTSPDSRSLEAFSKLQCVLSMALARHHSLYSERRCVFRHSHNNRVSVFFDHHKPVGPDLLKRHLAQTKACRTELERQADKATKSDRTPQSLPNAFVMVVVNSVRSFKQTLALTAARKIKKSQADGRGPSLSSPTGGSTNVHCWEDLGSTSTPLQSWSDAPWPPIKSKLSS